MANINIEQKNNIPNFNLDNIKDENINESSLEKKEEKNNTTENQNNQLLIFKKMKAKTILRILIPTKK